MVSLGSMAQKKEVKRLTIGNGVAVNSMMVPDDRNVDTLSIWDRIALRTNMFDWLLLTPNIGVEFDVKGRNWNRWAVGLNVRGNWQTSHTYKPEWIYNLREVRLEGRQYWRTRDMSTNRNQLERHKKWHLWDKAVSIRRKRAKHPLTTDYRGLYVSYADYSIKLFDTGRQGSAVMAGITYGIQRPIFDFQNGNSLAFEVGISAGAMYTKYSEYTYDMESDCYPVQKVQPWKLVKHPVINDISLSLVYRLGTTPVTHKYRYRDDVDEAYFHKKVDRRERHLRERDSTKTYREAYDSISREFWHVYDQIALTHRQSDYEERLKIDQERRQQKADARMAKALNKKQKQAQSRRDDDEAQSRKDDEAEEPKEGKEAEDPKEGKEGGDE